MKSNNRAKTLITPIFTLFFYSHTWEEYEKLRAKLKQKMVRFWRYDSEFEDFYNHNRKRVEANILKALEKQYPTPLYWLYWNDIAGFIAIKIENPIENFRIIAEVWSIKNRRFKTKRVFTLNYSASETIRKELLEDETQFNDEFFKKLETLIKKISKEFIKKKHFYFSRNNNRLHWGLIRQCNIAAFLKELGHNWSY